VVLLLKSPLCRLGLDVITMDGSSWERGHPWRDDRSEFAIKQPKRTFHFQPDKCQGYVFKLGRSTFELHNYPSTRWNRVLRDLRCVFLKFRCSESTVGHYSEPRKHHQRMIPTRGYPKLRRKPPSYVMPVFWPESGGHSKDALTLLRWKKAWYALDLIN